MKMPDEVENKRKRSAAIPMQVVRDLPSLNALRKLVVKTWATSHVHSSGRYDSTHLLSDDRVMELHLLFGWHDRAFVFNNLKDWESYGYMPQNIYWDQ